MKVDCPVPIEKLVALCAGDLDESEVAAVEEHLFACDPCAATSVRLDGLVGELRETIPIVISHAHRDRMTAQGKRINVAPVEPGVATPGRFPRDHDLLVWALRGDLSEAERVMVDIIHPNAPIIALEDVPFDRARGEVLVACQRHFEGVFEGDPRIVVTAVQRGEKKQVGEYLVVHAWA